MPLSRPLVQTLVARNASLRLPNAARRSPTTASERPYMGELSITLPPAWNSRRRTFSSGARAAAFDPTSKVCQVPRPTTGSFSPLLGMGRAFIITPSAARLVPAARAAPAPRSEEHTSELQSLMRISYAVFCLKKKKKSQHRQDIPHRTQKQKRNIRQSKHVS